jgi:hypothetical protein
MTQTHLSEPARVPDQTPRLRAVLLVEDGLEIDAIVAVLGARLVGLELQVVADLAGIEASGATVLVVLLPPDKSLAAALAGREDGDMDAALAAWRDGRAGLLAAHRQRRRRMTLIDAALMGRGGSAAGWTALAQRLGIRTIPTTPGIAVDADVARAAPAFYRVAAMALMQRDSALAELVAELDAVTLGSDADDTAAAIMPLLAEMQRDAEETTLLRENLALQLELETANAAQSAEQGKALAAARRETEEVRALLQVERSARTGNAQRAAEAQARRDAVLGAALLGQVETSDRLTHRAEALEAELHRVYGSRSWRVTRPLRAAMARLRPAR